MQYTKASERTFSNSFSLSFSLISCCSSPALFTLFIKLFLEWFSIGEKERNQLKSGETTSFFWEMKQMKAVHLEIFQSLVLKPGYYLHHLLYAPAKWIRAFPSGMSLRITSIFPPIKRGNNCTYIIVVSGLHIFVVKENKICQPKFWHFGLSIILS